MKKNFFTLFLCAFLPCTITAMERTVLASPDGKVKIAFFSRDNRLWFDVMRDGIPVLEPSPLDFSVDGIAYCADVRRTGSRSYEVDETYRTRGPHSQAVNRCNGLVLDLTAGDKHSFALEARAYNDGVAFRFVVPEDKRRGERVPDEATVFKLPAGSHIWYHDMYNHYEGIFERQQIGDVQAGEWAAPPITVELPGGAGYAVLTEAALAGYAGMSLQADGENGLTARLGHAQPAGYPFAHDYSLAEAQRLSAPAALSGTITTPWRTVIVAGDLNTLVNTDLITNLSPAPDPEYFPQGMDTEWIRPGRSVWCWLDGGERTVEGMKAFSKLAGELGFEYNTVDAFWYRWTDEQIKELVDYSAQFGVKVWLWRHGRDVRDPQKRRELFERCERLGVVGLKLDAFSHESKEFVDLYQACLREAAEHKLMLNIHGSNKPTGEARTWPNEMTREGIRGLEYGRNQAEWSKHNTTLPFTRFVVGAGDYTPVIFGERRLETTWVHQIGTAVVFNSPVMIYGANPESILKNPGMDIIKTLPVTWDETVVLPCSRIGRRAAFARRSGDDWYLAVLNGGDDEALQLPLDFLPAGEWFAATVYNDRPGNPEAIKIEKAFCRSTDSFTARMPHGGGFVVRFIRQ